MDVTFSQIPHHIHHTVLARYQNALEEGTLDVSDHGIVLVNRGNVLLSESEIYSEDTVTLENREMMLTDYHVGDTVDFLDMNQYYERANKLLQPVQQENEKELKDLEEQLRKKEITQEEKEKQEAILYSVSFSNIW